MNDWSTWINTIVGIIGIVVGIIGIKNINYAKKAINSDNIPLFISIRCSLYSRIYSIWFENRVGRLKNIEK